MKGFGLTEKPLHVAKRNHAGSVTEGPAGLWMGFEEETVATYSHRCSHEVGNKLRTPSPWIFAWNAVISNDMGRIEDDRAADLLHDRNGTEVRDQLIIPETGSALC